MGAKYVFCDCAVCVLFYSSHKKEVWDASLENRVVIRGRNRGAESIVPRVFLKPVTIASTRGKMPVHSTNNTFCWKMSDV